MSRRAYLRYLVPMAACLLAACGGATLQGSGAPSERGLVYRVDFSARSPDGQTSASNAQARTEWVDPSTGRFRVEEDGRSFVYDGARWAIDDPASGSHVVREGDARFLGSGPRETSYGVMIGAEDLAKAPIDQSVPVAVDGVEATMVVRQVLTAAQAAGEGLFDPRIDGRTSTIRQLTAGSAPTLPVTAYWLGSKSGERSAQVSVEIHWVMTDTELADGTSAEAAEPALYEVHYVRGDPGVAPSNAFPSDVADQIDDLVVSSRPIDAPSAKNILAVADGRNAELVYEPWPRHEAKLADGQRATVIALNYEGPSGYAVATSSTLVTISGGDVSDDSIDSLVKQLSQVG